MNPLKTHSQAKKQMFQVVPDNSVSILWQIPQIAIITAAEILFSITGLEFAYSQAAPSMKSVVQAFWLLTTSTGNMLIGKLFFGERKGNLIE
jgi:solute carrier family 15 oligopeptide transporter 1